VVLRVDGNELEVRTANKKTVKGFFTLDDLDVVMDTKTIRKVQDGRDAIPALRFNGAVGPEIDTARVVLTSERERLALTDDFVSHTNAIEWFGKIRVFLRKQGWVPADERVPTDGADPGGG
jgi:hypothetical protein